MSGRARDRRVYRLQGLSFLDELQGEQINFRDSILYLGLIPWESCNWKCRVCHEVRRWKEDDELSVQEMTRIVSEAADLGIRSLLLLGGEVLLRSTWATTR